MALPLLLAAGAVLGAIGTAGYKIANPSDAGKALKVDTVVAVQPKTALQRTAANVLQTLLF